MHRLLFSLLLLASPVWAQQLPTIPDGKYVLADVEVQGNASIERATIITFSGLVMGQTIQVPGDDIAAAMRRLWKQNVFEDVAISALKIEDNRIYLLIQVAETPRLARYSFEGVKKTTADELREKIKFVRGQRFTEAKKRQAVRIVRNYFMAKGHYDAQIDITSREDPSAPNGIIATVKIRKGRKHKIQAINISGLEEISERKLKAKMKDTKERRIYSVFKRSKFVTSDYEADKEKIIQYLQSKGYRDARVLSDTVRKVEGRNLVRVDMQLFQGRQYYIRSIQWDGNQKYATGRLDTLLNIRPGDIYNTTLLSKRLYGDPSGNDISSLYQDDGYLFFNIEPIERAVVGDSIDLVMQVYEGPIAHYDRIIIEGNRSTSDYVILREIRTLPGNKFSRAEVIRTQRELMALGYFNDQTMNVTPVPNPEKGTVDMKYFVEEKASDQLFFQMGWGGRVMNPNAALAGFGGGLIGTVGVTLNNFSTKQFFKKGAWQPIPKGDGQRLTLRAQVNGRGFQNYGVSFMEPWFGGHKPNSLGMNVNYSIQSWAPTGFRINILGTSVDWGQRMKVPDDFFRSYTTLGYRYYHVQNAGSFFPAMPNGFVNIISLKQTFDRTSSAPPIFPTSGSVLTFSVEGTPPYSLFRQNTDYAEDPSLRFRWLEFHKWSFRTEAYIRMTRSKKLPMILFPRAMFGFLGAYNRDLGVSPFERYYIGGDGLFGFNLDGREIIAGRGYDGPYLGPSGGGTIYSKYTLELRQPIALSPMASVWVHAFAEASNAWGRFRDYNPFELYRAVGGGVRLFLPMFGLIGLDFARPLDDAPNNLNDNNTKKYTLHFMIGQQF
ncbi:MAG: outer membrane protein assembly factor BamA [Bacteroidetes bacterium]|nr:outer membrane protein assembly factor BamA [Bacteroidota bacterium]